MRILNLYSGIGGNRKLWGNDHEITAVEYKPEIAKIYQDHFPQDKVVIGDAHQYLLDHFSEFDFIWSSPPCPTHSKVRKAVSGKNMIGRRGYQPPVFPNMVLYQEILFLQGYFEGLWCVENVVSWYEPLIKPNHIADHYFWTNFPLLNFTGEGRGMGKKDTIEILQNLKQFNLEKYKNVDKVLALRNCVEPELGKHILNFAINPIILQPSLV